MCMELQANDPQVVVSLDPMGIVGRTWGRDKPVKCGVVSLSKAFHPSCKVLVKLMNAVLKLLTEKLLTGRYSLK